MGSNPTGYANSFIMKALLIARVPVFVVEIKTQDDNKGAGSTPLKLVHCYFSLIRSLIP